LSLRVFITGGTSGLGLALARKFHSEGHTVGVCGRDPSKVPDEPFEVIAADVSIKEDMFKAVEFFETKYGDIDIMVANAGIGYSNKSKLPDFDRSRKMCEINVMGTLNAVEAVFDKMIKRKTGQLVAVSSISGLNGLPGVSCYSGSKGFQALMFESFAIDLKEFGVYATTILPGWMDTPFVKSNAHPMPFKMPPEKAAAICYKGIMKKKALIFFPRGLYYVVRLLSILPRGIYRKLFKIRAFNFSRDK
jgi:short-subunit dehydrogenase